MSDERTLDSNRDEAASGPCPRSTSAVPDDRVLDLDLALAEEFQALYGKAPEPLLQPGEAGPPDPAFSARIALNHMKEGTAALCFSGGGIRSASFCLGAAQALARKGLLPEFKYISTVSGGGYTGSMLAAWAYRAPGGLADVVEGLRNPAVPHKPNPVDWLRRYCNYLAPRRGLLSTDTWTIFVTYLRNLLLNWLILIPCLMVVVAVPRLIAASVDGFSAEVPALTKRTWAMALLGIAIAALLVASVRMRIFSGQSVETGAYAGRFWSRTITGLVGIFAVVFTFGWIVEALGPAFDRTYLVSAALGWTGIDPYVSRNFYWAIALGAVGLAMGLIFAFHFQRPGAEQTTWRDRRTVLVAHLVGGIATGAGMAAWEISFTFHDPPTYGNVAHVLVLGPPGLFLAVALGEAAFLGITSKLSDDYHREWWSRLFGFMSRWALLWMVVGGVSFAGPWVLNIVLKPVHEAILYPASVLAAGAALARFAFTHGGAVAGGDEKARRRTTSLKQAAFLGATYLFIVLLLCFLAWLTHYLTVDEKLRWPFPPLVHARELPFTFDRIGFVVAALLVLLVLASAFVNVNKFSLHSMYRDRLIRAFLGASREQFAASAATVRQRDDAWRENHQFGQRASNPYTDFDRDDNPLLWWLSSLRTDPRKAIPFLVINGALNLTRTQNLAWQERKAASFTFTPLHVGSHLTNYAPAREFCGEVGGVTLGTAMAISGAAVSPNAGYHSTPTLTFLLTLFNARLGWWLGNPRRPVPRRAMGPTHALGPMVSELQGKTDEENDWVYVSDGGHFDNLGIYEMVRRGCRYILAIDASADPRFEYDSLGIAIRKIRVDFGIPIDLQGSMRIGECTGDLAGAHCAIFRIGYYARAGKDYGVLVYVKASHYPRGPSAPVDVRQYAYGSMAFPHEPTTDQFFGESQFESYRAQGEWEIEEITQFAKSVESFQDLASLAAHHIRARTTAPPGAKAPPR